MAVYGEEARWHWKWSKVHLFIQVVNSPVQPRPVLQTTPTNVFSVACASTLAIYAFVLQYWWAPTANTAAPPRLPLFTVVNCDRRKKQGFGYNPFTCECLQNKDKCLHFHSIFIMWLKYAFIYSERQCVLFIVQQTWLTLVKRAGSYILDTTWTGLHNQLLEKRKPFWIPSAAWTTQQW